MAVQFGWQLINTMLYSGMWYYNLGGTGQARHIYCTVFPGVQPSAASIISSWSTYSALYLAHYIYSAGSAWVVYNESTEGTAFVASTQSPTATAFRTGTATWGIIWTNANGPSAASVQGASLPLNTFIVAPVGNISSTDVIRLNSTSIVATTTTTLASIVIDIALNPGD